MENIFQHQKLINMANEIITDEDNMMLLKLIGSLNINNYHEELNWEELMSALEVAYMLGADVIITFGISIYINIDTEYFNRTQVKDNLGAAIFEAMHHFSLWYLKNKTNGRE
jgi:CII-binding regulator of phage lambda lysogenization HflD